MQYISLNDIKKHLNIDLSFVADDDYLTSLYDVSFAVVLKHIDCEESDLLDGNELKPDVRHAMLLLIGNLYANRESVAFSSATELPLGYNYILSLLKTYR